MVNDVIDKRGQEAFGLGLAEIIFLQQKCRCCNPK